MKIVALVIVLLSVLLTACSGGPAPAQPPPRSGGPTPAPPTPRPLIVLPSLPHGAWGFAPIAVPEETLVHINQWGGFNEICIYPEGLAVCSETTMIGRDGRIRVLSGKWVKQDTRMTRADLKTLTAALDQVDGSAIQAGLVPHHCEMDGRTGVTFFTTAERMDFSGCDADFDRSLPPFNTIDSLLEHYLREK